jgi:hypothetical protein
MSYVRDDIKFVLTNYGKEQGLKHGFLNIFKYFTVSDDGVIYTMEVEPTDLNDINGLHTTSSKIPNGNKNIIQK